MKIKLTWLFILVTGLNLQAQKINDSTSPLHLMKPDYQTPYGKLEVKGITEILDRVYNYLDKSTPIALVNKETQAEATSDPKFS